MDPATKTTVTGCIIVDILVEVIYTKTQALTLKSFDALLKLFLENHNRFFFSNNLSFVLDNGPCISENPEGGC